MLFFASVTHELRTPLSGALGAAALLEETGLKPDQAAYLDAVRSSAAHALNLIDDILDITRLEAGRLELREEAVNPRALIEDVAEILAPRAAEKGLSLAHAVDAAVPERVRAEGHAFTDHGGADVVTCQLRFADGVEATGTDAVRPRPHLCGRRRVRARALRLLPAL